MDGDLSSWSSGLLLAVLCVLLGTIGVVSASRSEERWLASGLLWQGTLLTFVVAGAYFHRSSPLYLGGLVVLGLLMIQTLQKREFHDDRPANQDEVE